VRSTCSGVGVEKDIEFLIVVGWNPKEGQTPERMIPPSVDLWAFARMMIDSPAGRQTIIMPDADGGAVHRRTNLTP